MSLECGEKHLHALLSIITSVEKAGYVASHKLLNATIRSGYERTLPPE
ncbi:hypothetical protein [Leptolyngbya boryana]|nr:hypothetical protein [Leptolyngbya boryana]ULP30579.1 hypothetical protein MCP04_02145 [Leptolyngbya boryana IU 594]